MPQTSGSCHISRVQESRGLLGLSPRASHRIYKKNHGTWKSDAIHTYLMSTPSLSSPVSRAFVASLYSLFLLGSWVSQLLLLVTYIKFYLVEITVYLAMPILMGHLQNRFTALWLTSPPFCNYNQTDTLSSHWLDGLTFAMAFSPLVFFKLLST